ncbi:MAG: hypothetical protein OEZ01_17340 [Candidatus Heimdallarchaeota archaeon]|nr:hypothetical protein [Candidatus Heimdallarchaeota archaeon]
MKNNSDTTYADNMFLMSGMLKSGNLTDSIASNPVNQANPQTVHK